MDLPVPKRSRPRSSFDMPNGLPTIGMARCNIWSGTAWCAQTPNNCSRVHAPSLPPHLTTIPRGFSHQMLLNLHTMPMAATTTRWCERSFGRSPLTSRRSMAAISGCVSIPHRCASATGRSKRELGLWAATTSLFCPAVAHTFFSDSSSPPSNCLPTSLAA